MKSWSGDVTFRQGMVTPVRVRLRPSMGRVGGYVTAGFSLAAIGGGVALGLMANHLYTQVQSDVTRGVIASNDPRLNRGFAYSIGADASFALGVVLSGFALYYFLRDPLPDSEATVLDPRDWAFAPILSPTQVGGALSVRF